MWDRGGSFSKIIHWGSQLGASHREIWQGVEILEKDPGSRVLSPGFWVLST